MRIRELWRRHHADSSQLSDGLAALKLHFWDHKGQWPPVTGQHIAS
jgi:hypothetical protein